MKRRLLLIFSWVWILVAGEAIAEKAESVERVLVFGASGRIGQHIVEEGLRRGYAITGVSRFAERLSDFAGRINIETGDVLDRDRVRELIVAHDAIIVSIGGAPQNKNPETYIAALAAASLIDVLQEMGEDGPRLIFVGNLFTLIYQEGETLLDMGRVDESHQNYAMFYGHQIALDLFRASKGVNWTVATPPNGLRLQGFTGNVRFGGDELLRDPDGAPAQISREDFAFAVYEELAAGRYVRQRFNTAR
ncbi:MAG: NAD(P)H-binding protein [Xanthomonadales bacterium]|nr:NAD(P)H-binding protein [Xanthomonadales bacterium]